MHHIQKIAVITELVDKLRKKGSWCGETHLQKALFILSELLNVDLGFDFILYKHGPFSFDLRDELIALRADGLLKLVPQSPPYGPSLRSTKSSKELRRLSEHALSRYVKKLNFVAEQVGSKGVADLERLATALYVTKRESRHKTEDRRIKRITELKPHISEDDARQALCDVQNMIQEARKAFR